MKNIMLNNTKNNFKNGLLIITSLITSYAQAGTQVYKVEDFANDLYAKVRMNDLPVMTVYEKKTGKSLIKQITSIDTADNNNGKVTANIVELPYGEQSALIYDDMNFDGKADIAIKDGNMSCYGGPAYQVYLRTGKGFKHSKDFTRLAQEYCGFFHIDHKNKVLSTMTKSGAAWHQYSTFKVVGDKPVTIEIVEEEHFNGGLEQTIYKPSKGKMIKSQKVMFDDNQDFFELSRYRFKLKNNKTMILGDIYGSAFYALLNKNKQLELFYKKDFTYHKSSDRLDFQIHKTGYSLGKNDITITLPNKKKVTLKAVPYSGRGQFADVLNLENVEHE